MSETQKLSSLSIFFPFFNDAGTVIKALDLAFKVGKKVTDDLEVIAIHGGNSRDATDQELQKAQETWPELQVIDARQNTRGYAVIARGFQEASKDWVFYTDGDLQYDVTELLKLVKVHQDTQATVVNGYKVSRSDNFWRQWLGESWRRLAYFIFHLPIRDVDCDFRLIKTSLLKKIKLHQTGAAVLEELILKLQATGAVFAEVPVTHLEREYGTSNYSLLTLVREKVKTFTFYFGQQK